MPVFFAIACFLLVAILTVLIIGVGFLSKLSMQLKALKEEVTTVSIQLEELDFKTDDCTTRNYDGSPELIYIFWR